MLVAEHSQGAVGHEVALKKGPTGDHQRLSWLPGRACVGRSGRNRTMNCWLPAACWRAWLMGWGVDHWVFAAAPIKGKLAKERGDWGRAVAHSLAGPFRAKG